MGQSICMAKTGINKRKLQIMKTRYINNIEYLIQYLVDNDAHFSKVYLIQNNKKQEETFMLIDFIEIKYLLLIGIFFFFLQNLEN